MIRVAVSNSGEWQLIVENRSNDSVFVDLGMRLSHQLSYTLTVGALTNKLSYNGENIKDEHDFEMQMM